MDRHVLQFVLEAACAGRPVESLIGPLANRNKSREIGSLRARLRPKQKWLEPGIDRETRYLAVTREPVEHAATSGHGVQHVALVPARRDLVLSVQLVVHQPENKTIVLISLILICRFTLKNKLSRETMSQNNDPCLQWVHFNAGNIFRLYRSVYLCTSCMNGWK